MINIRQEAGCAAVFKWPDCLITNGKVWLAVAATLSVLLAGDPAVAASQDPTTTTNPAPSNNASKSRKVLDVIKTNIKETFELDPRLKKDLTDSPRVLAPIKFMQDYCAVGYNPNIEWDRSGGDGTGNTGTPTHLWSTSYTTRALTAYLAGPMTKHLSGWFQLTPTDYPHHFFQHFEMFQGMANYGTDKTFVQIRGGQGFNWQNAGFGGADRTITQTGPGVYTAFNGFDPTATSKFISLEATGMNWTTGKVYGYWQPNAGTSADPNIAYHRGYGMGLAMEKLIGKTGISGIQTNLAIGNTPAFNANPDTATRGQAYIAGQQAISQTIAANQALQDQANQAASQAYSADIAAGLDIVTASNDANSAAANVISNAGGFTDPQQAGQAAAGGATGTVTGTQSSPYIWWTSWINKSIQDKKGNVRLNPSFGLTVFRVKRYLDDPNVPEARSTGCGYTFDLVAIPVTSYWTTILRYDYFRATDLVHRNETGTFTLGQAFDFHSGNKSRMRVTLDYQVVRQKGIAPAHRFILAFWPIW